MLEHEQRDDVALVREIRARVEVRLHAVCVARAQAFGAAGVRIGLDQDVAEMRLLRRLPRHIPTRPTLAERRAIARVRPWLACERLAVLVHERREKEKCGNAAA